MQDRYLFKAKRKDDGEWVFGGLSYCEKTNAYFITNMGKDNISYIGFHQEVDSDTICQCTLLKDKNGKLIFENDIVELYDRNIDYKWRAVVLFGNPNCEYTWGWQLKPIGECEANADILCWINMEESGAFCEVIGSSIDNPELLEK